MKIDRISLLDTYTRVVESRSLSNVARDLGLSQSTISRRLSELEDNLGVRLLNRNTRSMVPTRDGQAFYKHACEIVQIADQAAREISGDETGLGGLVRIGTSAAFGQHFILPRLPPILKRWPRISIDLYHVEGPPDMLAQGLDIAIWSGEISDQPVIKRKVGQTGWIILACRSYMNGRSALKQPSDLAIHDFVRNSALPFSDELTLKSIDGEEQKQVLVTGRLSVNTNEAALEAVRAGLGIAVLPTWFVRPDELPGDLVEVLPEFSIPASDVQLLFPSRKLPSRTRALLDHLADELEAELRGTSSEE